jgi:serine/threonine protein kinase
MPGLFHILRCVGRAVVKNGGKALCSLVPFGEVAFEISKDAYEEYRKGHAEADLRADLEALAQAGQAEVRQAAEAVADQEAADQPAEARLALACYLNQLPASIRQSLRRPSDPGGTTAPAGLSLKRPEDLLPFLPAGLPRFRPGDRPLAADWELVELLGKGGFGEVWKARHLTRSRQKPVALKFCLDPVAAATLRNEAALHDHLDRVREEASAPGIVPLLETYLRAEPPCLMYEFIEGGDLAGLVHEMQAEDRLTPEFATRIVYRLATIVGAAHRLDPPLVHRDLKMSNVLVRRGDGDLPDLFVADFGIGGLAAGQALREQAGRRTLHSQLLPTAIRGAHTPLYASPQQARGEPADPRDDVHALGVLWYQLATGDLTMRPIPPDWQDVVAEEGMGEELIQVMASCLASRAEKRPADASDLAERFQKKPELTESQKEILERLRKAARRRASLEKRIFPDGPPKESPPSPPPESAHGEMSSARTDLFGSPLEAGAEGAEGVPPAGGGRRRARKAKDGSGKAGAASARGRAEPRPGGREAGPDAGGELPPLADLTAEELAGWEGPAAGRKQDPRERLRFFVDVFDVVQGKPSGVLHHDQAAVVAEAQRRMFRAGDDQRKATAGLRGLMNYWGGRLGESPTERPPGPMKGMTPRERVGFLDDMIDVLRRIPLADDHPDPDSVYDEAARQMRGVEGEGKEGVDRLIANARKYRRTLAREAGLEPRPGDP